MASVESLLGAGVAFGVLFLSVAVFDSGDNLLRFAFLGLSGSAVALAFISAYSKRGPGPGATAVVATAYFCWAGLQEFAQTSDPLRSIPSVIGVLLCLTAGRARLAGVLAGLRRWFLVVVVIALLPAVLGEGFAPGRVWLPLLPGRYFGFSNPDALGFIAGIAIVLSWSTPERWRRRLLVVAGWGLFAISASYSPAIALSAALLAYHFVHLEGVASLCRRLVWLFSGLSLAALAWVSTEPGIAAARHFSGLLDLSGRTVIWAELLRYARSTGYFWTGLGDAGVARYTLDIGGVGSAHATMLQILLSKGYLTTVFFVLVVTFAAQRTLTRAGEPDAMSVGVPAALLVYWFVISLASIQPGAAMGLLLVLVVSLPRSGADDTPPGGRREPVMASAGRR